MVTGTLATPGRWSPDIGADIVSVGGIHICALPCSQAAVATFVCHESVASMLLATCARAVQWLRSADTSLPLFLKNVNSSGAWIISLTNHSIGELTFLNCLHEDMAITTCPAHQTLGSISWFLLRPQIEASVTASLTALQVPIVVIAEDDVTSNQYVVSLTRDVAAAGAAPQATPSSFMPNGSMQVCYVLSLHSLPFLRHAVRSCIMSS